MPGSRESSVWRTLAVAFGDGLAFGVGLTLTNNATRAVTAKSQLPHPDLHSLADRLEQIEQRLDRARFAATPPAPAVNTAQISRVAEAVIAAMDSRFGELEAQTQQRLAELESRIKADLEALDAGARSELSQALEAQHSRAESDLRVLRSQMLQVHREFADTLARLVDEQIERTISLRLDAIHQQTRETVREQSREERAAADRQLAEVRARLQAHESDLVDTLRTLAQSCMQAAARIAAPAPPAQSPSSNGGGGGTSETFITAAGAANDLPTRRPWKISAASAFLPAIRYLVV